MPIKKWFSVSISFGNEIGAILIEDRFKNMSNIFYSICYSTTPRSWLQE